MEIKIRYPHGEMTIAPEFFPTTQTRVNKLLKAVYLDGEPDEVIGCILAVLQEGIEQDEKTLKAVKVQAPQLYDLLCKTKELADTAKRPSGVRLTQQELKTAQKGYKRIKAEFKGLEREFSKVKRHKAKLEENMGYIINKTSDAAADKGGKS